MIGILFGMALGMVFMKVKRMVWCRSCVNGEQLGHTRECQIRHMHRYLRDR